MNDLNIKMNALFTNDNLYVLNGMNSDCIDLIYLDPPFNSKRLYKAPIGGKKTVLAFKDMWTWDDVDSELLVRLAERHPHLVNYIGSLEKAHSRAMMAYIAYMTQRLFEMHRVLKPTGSIYLHCDPTASHYLKTAMDFIFGNKNFRNEIVWSYSGGGMPRRDFGRKHDIILRYAKSDDFTFHKPYRPYAESCSGRHSNGKPVDLARGAGMTAVWTDLSPVNTQAKENTGYPTQKPKELLERIIKASSNEGDVVLDPFCGCATTCVKAQHLNRRWIGIDLSPITKGLIQRRLKNDVGLFNKFNHFTDLPDRHDVKRTSKREAKKILYGEQGGYCGGCGIHFPPRNLEVDHRIPKSKGGGGDFMENYQLLCGGCNREKGDRPMEFLKAAIRNRDSQHSIFGATPDALRNL